MTAEPWLVRRDHADGIAELMLNRAPVNALSPEFLMDFARQADALTDDRGVRAIVVTSAFKVFSAGLDLKEAQGFDVPRQNAVVDGLNVAFLRLYACPKPTVVAVSGAAIAGGLFFPLAADQRLASPRASFGLAEVRVGVDFPIGPLEIARATLDTNSLRRLMLTGRPIDAETALAAGIVDRIVDDPDALVPEAIRAAAALAESPPQAYASVKRQIRSDVIARIEAGLQSTAGAGSGWFTDETRAAMQRMIG